MKRTILFILGILVLSQIAFAGVTNPLPTELNLLKGESGRFKFQIQTVASNQEIDCVYRLEKEFPLEVEFDPAEITVPAGAVRDVYGTVTVPGEVDFGIYEANFCISCEPSQGMGGTAVKVNTCDLPIKVNVVATRDKENMFIPPKPFEITIGMVIIALIVILIVAGIGYYLWRAGYLKPKKKK